MKNSIQKFGKFLSSMVMPNIGALIAFGFLAALFIDTGWLPNKQLSTLVGPMLTYLIPVLIASTGGYLVAGERGRVIGAIAVVGAILSDLNITMLMGAMIMGPLAGLVIKTFDSFMEDRMPAGFEMLINNFSIGILGMLLAIFGYWAVGPVMAAILAVLSVGVDTLVQHNLLPLIAVFIEPAKVLFLNNAINHGIFTPLATAQVLEHGKSILYMLEANPGPGLGVLLAYMFFCKDKTTKDSAPSAVIIHLFGGIHEIYFPYVLANPLLLISMIAGSSASLLFFSIFGGGLVAPASPGSIISVLAMAPKGQTLIVLAGVLIAAGVSFAVSLPLIKGRKANAADNQVNADVNISGSGTRQRIKFACDAGMGSSALGATRFRKRAAYENIDADISNCAIEDIPADTDIVVCQNHLKDRALERVERNSAEGGKKTVVIGIENFMDDPALDRLLESLKGVGYEVLAKDNILTGLKTESKDDAILRAGHLLEQKGYVRKGYAEAMLKRENESTTYMGMGIAIPHGTDEAKKDIIRSGIVILQYPEGVDFGDEKAYLIAGIAGKGDEHIEILASLGETFEDEDKLKTLMSAEDPNIIYNILNNNE